MMKVDDRDGTGRAAHSAGGTRRRSPTPATTANQTCKLAQSAMRAKLFRQVRATEVLARDTERDSRAHLRLLPAADRRQDVFESRCFHDGSRALTCRYA